MNAVRENVWLDGACARAARRSGGSGSWLRLVIVTILEASANKIVTINS